MGIEHTPEAVLQDAMQQEIEDVVIVMRTHSGAVITGWSDGSALTHLGMLRVAEESLVERTREKEDGEPLPGPTIQ